MVFSSLLFLFWFIPIFFAVYYILPARFRNTALFIGSIIFYAWGEPKFLILIFISIIVNYIAGILMHKSPKLVLTLALVFDFAMLFVFKYTGFFIGNINNIFGTSISAPALSLPLGISFYTFQIASYVIDLYRGKIKACKNPLTLGTYLVMFPQLIAGPIVVYETVEAELKSRKITPSMVEEGIGTFIIGLSSKVLIANQVGALWNDLEGIGYERISMPLAWLGVVAYTLQIYFDFNGYSLMAIGLGKMLGFNISRNFNNPYISRSLTEFWRRWHITLSTWFREYVYIPLGGNRKGKVRTFVNLFIVWFLTGFWHGAGWNFIIWGLFFFVFLSFEKLFLGKYLEKSVIFSRIYSLILIGLSWMIFAITDFELLGQYFRKLFMPSFGDDVVYYLRNYGVVIILGCIFSTPFIGKWFEKVRRSAAGVVILLALFVICVAYLADASYNPFLYFRF